jgi:NADH-quinone oxidoreductase subunit L
MVAAGVYLVGRFYPVFTPEVLLVISVIGCITLFMAATIAITATDIKRVLAYSTISQLGYMMLALGVGGWVAGLMHLITHAFFKSLLFMCSGSVIHAVHTNDMRKMGGLFSKMPVTAITMLIGCLAIAGVGLPFVVGFSGYYSKDAILEQALSFSQHNSSAWPLVLFGFAAGGAAVTAFYMFRMWYLTFVGTPRDHHAYEHAHESPPVMYLPLVVLSVFAVTVAWSTSAIGFAIVPAATLIYLGVKHHWFQAITASAGHIESEHISPPKPGHSDHAGDVEETAAHSPEHLHQSHTISHAAHHGDDHGHGQHEHGSSPATQPQLTWSQLALLTVATFVVGGIVMPLVPDASLNLANLLENARPAGTSATTLGTWVNWTWPNEHLSHADPVKIPVTLLATGTWALGITLATLMYCVGWLNPEEVRRQFSPIYRLLVNKWWFDELYDAIFVRPTFVISRFIANIDRTYIDGFLDFLARVTVGFARWWDYFADRGVVDGLANLIAGWTYSLGLGLRSVQTGQIRQYVLFIVVGAVAVFLLISFFWTPILAR